MNTTNTVILGACLIAAALIVALPGLDDMRREHRIRQECEVMMPTEGFGPQTLGGPRPLAIERCVSIVLNARPAE